MSRRVFGECGSHSQRGRQIRQRSVRRADDSGSLPGAKRRADGSRGRAPGVTGAGGRDSDVVLQMAAAPPIEGKVSRRVFGECAGYSQRGRQIRQRSVRRADDSGSLPGAKRRADGSRGRAPGVTGVGGRVSDVVLQMAAAPPIEGRVSRRVFGECGSHSQSGRQIRQRSVRRADDSGSLPGANRRADGSRGRATAVTGVGGILTQSSLVLQVAVAPPE